MMEEEPKTVTQYGKYAFETFTKELSERGGLPNPFIWEELPEDAKEAWIEVGYWKVVVGAMVELMEG